MVSDDDFTIISVSSDDDDGIVIQVGANEASDAQEPSVITETIATEYQDTNGVEQEKYHETTQEDLEAIGPLPKARIIIIVAGVLLIIGFFLYYTFLQ